MNLQVFSRNEADIAPLPSVGPKAATLARLAREAVPVPEFFVVPSVGLSLHLEANGVSWPGADASRDALTGLAEHVLAAAVPASVGGPVIEAYDHLCRISGHPKVAVRSSAAEEDTAAASFAGQFSSVLDVHGHDAVLDAVRQCWASYLSPRSLDYRAERGMSLGGEPRLAVIVQVQVFSDSAGVLFTEHPLDPGGDSACIEANFGTGDSVVGGLAMPDTISMSRSTGEVLDAHIGTKRRMTSVSSRSTGSSLLDLPDDRRSMPVLTGAEAQTLLRLGLRIEQLLGGPQDIEWAYEGNSLWILQARPITSVSPDRR